MAATFEVIALGNLPLIDTAEGNQFVSQAAVNSWLGTYGSLGDPLSNSGAIQTFAPGAAGFAGGISSAYDIDNNNSNDTFTIDGVEKTHDATMLFNATLTYKDGSTATITAVVAQDTNGDAYLMPEVTDNADAAALALPVASITLDSPIYANGNPGQGFNLTGDRFATNFVPCFTPGTMIATPKGLRPVEVIAAGDRVVTRDAGIRKVRWVGHRALAGADLAARPRLRPILIRAGALGPDRPDRDMAVSPNHRMLLTGGIAELLFGEREVLAAAKHLTGLAGIDRVAATGVIYVHMMFDHHQVLLADGAWSESFQPGAYAMDGVGRDQRNEIVTLFPELATPEGQRGYGAARRALRAHEARLLVREST